MRLDPLLRVTQIMMTQTRSGQYCIIRVLSGGGWSKQAEWSVSCGASAGPCTIGCHHIAVGARCKQ